jgi:ATP-dependent DNA ligase
MFPSECDLSKLSKEFILDCEVTSDNPNICTIMGNNGVVTNSQLQAVTSLLSSTPARAKTIQKNNNLLLVFNSFDCVYYDKQWIMNEPLYRRREVAEEIIQALENCGFNIRRVVRTRDRSAEGKRKFYNDLINHGGEGCVAKRLDGIYVPDTTRNFSGWIKLKRSAVQSYTRGMDMDDLLGDSGFGDTLDAFITGFVPGTPGSALEKYVGAVCVSINVQKDDGTSYVHEIGRFSGIDMALREDMTELVNGQPTLKPSYYNRVCEVDGLGVSSRALRLNHCTMLGFRYDKLPDSCVLTEEMLYKMINS